MIIQSVELVALPNAPAYQNKIYRAHLDTGEDIDLFQQHWDVLLPPESLVGLTPEQAQAVTSLCRGEPAGSVWHMEQAICLYDPARHRLLTSRFGQDPGVACRSFGAVALWLLGQADEAQVQMEILKRASGGSRWTSQAAVPTGSPSRPTDRCQTRTRGCSPRPR